MAKKMSFKKDKIYMLPIGGCQQFGANMTLYGVNGCWIAVDCGAAFADEKMPGVDLLLPNALNIPDEIIDNIQAVFITHAHEDHIGGLPWLWEELGAPKIYASRFATEVLKNKFSEKTYDSKPVFKELVPETPVTIGLNASKDFTITPVTVSHSIPEAMSLFIKALNKTLLHSGDWNLDETPVLPFKTDEALFSQYAGENGVLAYIGDSTNAENEGISPSEQLAADGLLETIKQAKGKVAVTLFSSNIARIQSICDAAKQTGRRIAVAGRSIENMVRAAQSVGYLQEIEPFLMPDEIGYLPNDKQIYLVTGSQGEFRATLSKIARGGHRHISLGENDTVIFSARKIPGNERAIQDVMNDFLGAGVSVITPKERDIHVSGHPYGGEIHEMLNWVKPKIMIPVHGEKSQIAAQGKIGEAHQKKICMPDNGSVVEIDPVAETAKIIYDYDCELRPIVFGEPKVAGYKPLKDRRRMSFHGCVFVTVSINERSLELSDLHLSTLGLLDLDDKNEMEDYQECLDDLEKKFYSIKRANRAELEHVEDELSLCVRRFFKQLYGIKPLTEVHAVIG